jgi:predicted metalloprotease with PDZ domain
VQLDWESFIRDRVKVPQDALPLSVVERCGYRLQFSPRSSERQERQERDGKRVSVLDSLGLEFGENGQISGIVPGMPGDRAGLAPGMMVQGVNGRRFSGRRLKDAIAESVTRRQIEFLLLEGDTFRSVTVHYAEGPKYLELARDPDRPDLWMSILKPSLGIPIETPETK